MTTCPVTVYPLFAGAVTPARCSLPTRPAFLTTDGYRVCGRGHVTPTPAVVCSWCEAPATRNLDTSLDQACDAHYSEWWARHRAPGHPGSFAVHAPADYRPRHAATPGRLAGMAPGRMSSGCRAG
jgi:hypothetical protein